MLTDDGPVYHAIDVYHVYHVSAIDMPW